MERHDKSRPLRPLIALKAVTRLARSRGKDERQAVIFLRALEGNSPRRAFDRFKQTPTGQRLLRDRPRLRDALIAAEASDRYPPNTLGYASCAFLRQNNLSVAGLMDLAISPLDRPLAEDEAYVEERACVMHDLWHVVTGYDAGTLGEVCLVAFRCAQVSHLAFRILALFMLVKPPAHPPGAPARRAIIEGWRRGKSAAWLRAADWEALLPMDLATVRQILSLTPPETYHRVLALAAPPSHLYQAADSAAPAT